MKQRHGKKHAPSAIDPRDVGRWAWVATGYLEAFRALSETSDWSHQRGGTPIFALYTLLRHSIELYLKLALAHVDWMRRQHGGLRSGHNLADLAKALDDRVPGTLGEPLSTLIVAIDALDPNGDTFRYPVNVQLTQWTRAVDHDGERAAGEIVRDGYKHRESLRTLPGRVDRVMFLEQHQRKLDGR